MRWGDVTDEDLKKLELFNENDLSVILSALELRSEYFDEQARAMDGYKPKRNDLIGDPTIVQTLFRQEAERSLAVARKVTSVLYGEDER